MYNFAECTLIKLLPSESYFIVLTTFNIYHGRSAHFLLRQKELATLLYYPGRCFDLPAIGVYVILCVCES